jgi:hypothetical protein
MKVLFYLPVVTPWWFQNIVEPLVRRVALIAEVHILVPEPWRSTGLGPSDIQRLADLPIHWAVADGPDHPSLRTAPKDAAGLIDFVTQMAPDYVLCRSADFATARAFPGKVGFLMEVASAPFDVAANTTTITPSPFVNGALPELSSAESDRLQDLIAPLWSRMREHWKTTIPAREDIFRHAGIPSDKPVLMLPLEYEHEENFFSQHRVGPPGNRALVTRIAKLVTPGCTLVVTNHPLNTMHVGDHALIETIGKLGRRVVLAPSDIFGISPTLALAPHVEGMILGDSKAYTFGACFGTPMVRRSNFPSADWLRCETDFDRFVSDVRAGRARGPEENDARLWFAYHLANEAFLPRDPELTGAMILDRIDREVNLDRWEAGIGRALPYKGATR